MRYFFKVILLLLAISFAGAGTAFYTDTINLDMDSSDTGDEPPVLVLEYDFQDHSNTHYLVDLWIDVDSDSDASIPDLTGAFAFKLMLNDMEIVDLSEAYNSWTLIETDDGTLSHRLTNQISLDQSLLNLPDGTYTLSVEPKGDHNIEEILDPLNIPIHYSSITHYQSAAYDSLSPNSIGLTLFFPDESSKYLIPVTRFVPQTNTTLRETVTQLENGPAVFLGLFDRSPIPPVPRIQLSGGTASLYMSSQLGFYNEYPNVAHMAANSLAESLGSIPEVQRIQFYFDNRLMDEGFIGVNTSTFIEPAQPPFMYVIYRAPNGRGLLMPRTIDDPLVSVNEMLQLLTLTHNYEFYSAEVQPTIPQEVRLIDYSLENNTLMVDFNQDFDNVFLENPLQGRMMLDSILFTLGSLEAVDNVLIRVEGALPSVDIGISFIEPLEIPSYINPEV